MSGESLDRKGRHIQRDAAGWLAQLERGALSPADQIRYDAWLRNDPRHGQILAELKAAWGTFDRLQDYPGAEGLADPDLLAPARAPTRGFLPVMAAVAACLAVGLLIWIRSAPSGGVTPVAAQPLPSPNRFLHLSDGSEVELADGSQVIERFTAGERRVGLLGGVAHFTVTKNPARPFIVEAKGVSVRAVGTAFDVVLAGSSVRVLVSEGKVLVGSMEIAQMGSVPSPREPVYLTAGQQAVVPIRAEAIAPIVRTLNPAELNLAFAWQQSRLEFDGTPLEEVVRRINCHLGNAPGTVHLEIGDPELRGVPISGRIRPDNVVSFVDVLSADFGLRAERMPDGRIVLRRP